LLYQQHKKSTRQGLQLTLETKEKLRLQLHKIGQASAAKDSVDGYVFDYSYDVGKQVFDDYESMRDEVKAIISDKSFLADRHKIAAFFLSAILKNKPVKIKENKNDTNNNDIEFLSNINLGIAFAAHCMGEIAGHKIALLQPNTTGKKSYKEQFYALIRLVKEHIDQDGSHKIFLMMISHIFFLLEENYKASNEIASPKS
jgi:hypothetical protein